MSATSGPILPAPDAVDVDDDDDDDGNNNNNNVREVAGGMRIGRGNRSSRGKPAPVPFCRPQIPHDLTWNPSRAKAVEKQL
jgi:hypothetical protein